jgi:hypothetical protein
MNSSGVDVQTLAARIERLEAANRRWKSASAIALLFVLSLLLLSTRHAERVAAAARPDRIEQDVLHSRTVEAQDFVLKDADGRVYARFAITPSFAERDQNGRSPRLYEMPVIPGQASIQFYDEKGKVVWSAPAKPQFMTVR